MNILPRQKHKIFLTSCIFVLFLSATLMSCGKKFNYEGGNIALSYDTDKWELTYVETEPDITLNLQSDENVIVIMRIEGDTSVVDYFHKEMIEMMQASYEVTEKGKTDQWDSQSWYYYEDVVNSDEPETIIIYAKELDGKMLVGFSEFSLLESEKENTEFVNEVLSIFHSIEYSDEAEVGDIVLDEDNSFARFLFNNLNIIIKHELVDTDADDLTATEEQQSGQTSGYISDEEFSKLEHVEKVVMDDYEGNETDYYAFAPIGNDGCDKGFISYWENSLDYTAYLYNDVGDAFLYTFLEDNVDLSIKLWDSASGYSNIQIGEIQKNGNDRYQILSAQKEDYNGIPYEVKKICYMDILDSGSGISWELEIVEIGMNAEDALIVEELAKCYNIDPDELQVNGEWAENDMERSANQQDVYTPADGDNELEKVNGYEYMGLTTLIDYNESVECPVMIPMGWNTSTSDNYASSSLHGINVLGILSRISDDDFLTSSNWWVDEEFKNLIDNTDKNRNVFKSETITLPEYNKGAYYVVFTYERKSYLTDGYVPMTNIMCFIKVNDDYYLKYTITLSQEEYDTSTNAVLKELEAAYGIDLSEYYYK